MKVKEESENVSLKLNIQKTKIMASGPITSWRIDGETMETVTDFFGGCSKIRASLVAQLVKKPPAMWETWVRSLHWEDPLQKRTAIHSSILAWRILWVEMIPWRREWVPAPVFWPREFHGLYSP